MKFWVGIRADEIIQVGPSKSEEYPIRVCLRNGTSTTVKRGDKDWHGAAKEIETSANQDYIDVDGGEQEAEAEQVTEEGQATIDEGGTPQADY